MIKKTTIAVALLASVQANAQNSFVGPSGQTVFQSKCSQSPEECYQEARQTCRGNYQVLDSESHAGGLLADIAPGPVTWYTISYSCGRSDGSLPRFERRGREPNNLNCYRLGRAVSCYRY